MKSNLSPEVKNKLDKFLDDLYLDVQGPGGGKTTALTEEYIIKLITRFAVSICTAWWSISELWEYVKKRNNYELLKRETAF